MPFTFSEFIIAGPKKDASYRAGSKGTLAPLI